MKKDTSTVLKLANQYAAFDGDVSEADLAVTAYFPKGFWVAEDESEIVGFAYGYFKEIPPQVLEKWGVTKVGHVELMAVAPSHRRKGTATALLGRLLKEFKDAGAEMVLLDCPAEAVEAKKLYDRMGFEPRFYGMRKRL